LIPNPAINAVRVNSDASGNIFIHTNMAEQFVAHPTIAGVFFLGHIVDFDSVFFLYAHDEDNNFYRVHYFRSVEQVQLFDNGIWVAPQVVNLPILLCFRNNVDVALNQAEGWRANVKLMDGFIISTVDTMTHITPATATSNSFVAGDWSTAVKYWNFSNSAYGRPLFFGENNRFLIRANPQGQVFYVDLHQVPNWNISDLENSANWSKGTLHLGTQFNMATIENFIGVVDGYVVAIHEGIFGTVIYKIYIRIDGDISYSVYQAEAFDPAIIVLFPLF